ncbi:MAG: trypsin-like serine protease [Pseudomonadota bacterium]
MKHTFLIILIFIWSATAPVTAVGQADTNLTVEFDAIDGSRMTSLDALDELELSPEEKQLAQTLFELSVQYQIDRNEAFGVELSIAPNGEPVLRPDFELGANEISISEEVLERYRGGVVGGVRGDDSTPASVEDEITIDLGRSLQDEGAYDASGEYLRPRKGQQQTVNPIDTGISTDDELKVEKLCNEDPNVCLPRIDGDPGAAGILVMPDLIMEAINASKIVTAAETSCVEAQALFRSEVEFDGSNGEDFNDWRNEPQAEILAKNFDDVCLDKAASIDARILDRLAVLKMPNVETPFCTAFRTGPATFLTARHCFHDRQRGKAMNDRMKQARVFMYRAPDVAIEIEEVRNSSGFDTSGQTNKEIKSINDFITLKAKAPDPSVSNLAISAPVIGAELVIPGHYIFADRRGVSVGPTTWQSEIRTSRRLAGGYCRIYDYSESTSGGACLIHRCQVMPGFSGSPMIQIDDQNEMSLVGVHVRGEGFLGHHCPSQFAIGSLNPVSRRGNIGVLPPPGSVDP